MVDLTRSHSLTDFQRNARDFIDGVNESREPMLLTVNGTVKAVLVDPATFQEMELKIERDRLLEALKEGLRDIDEGRTTPAEQVFAKMKSKYDL